MSKRGRQLLVTLNLCLWPIFSSVPAPVAAQDGELASPWSAGHKSRTRVSAGHVEDGGPPNNGSLYAFVEIQLSEGWKTYWRSPGDSGIPPRFDFGASQNLGKAVVLYPAPQRITDKGDIIIGYTGTVIFPVLLTRADPSKPIALNADVQFGLCKDICVPTQAKLDLTIPPGFDNAPSPDAKESLALVPRPASLPYTSGPHITRVITGAPSGPAKLTLVAEFPAGTEGADVFLEGPDGTYLPLLSKVSETGTSVTFEADLTSDVDLSALHGKSIGATVVSKAGATETSFKFE